MEPVDSQERRPPRTTLGGVPRPELATALRPRKEWRDEDLQQAVDAGVQAISGPLSKPDNAASSCPHGLSVFQWG